MKFKNFQVKETNKTKLRHSAKQMFSFLLDKKENLTLIPFQQTQNKEISTFLKK